MNRRSAPKGRTHTLRGSGMEDGLPSRAHPNIPPIPRHSRRLFLARHRALPHRYLPRTARLGAVKHHQRHRAVHHRSVSTSAKRHRSHSSRSSGRVASGGVRDRLVSTSRAVTGPSTPATASTVASSSPSPVGARPAAPEASSTPAARSRSASPSACRRCRAEVPGRPAGASSGCASKAGR
jgi:hypothetical protein